MRSELNLENRRLASILMTDGIGFSALVAKDERNARCLLFGCMEVLIRSVNLDRGYVFETTGHAMVAGFSSAVSAVQSALTIQAAINAIKERA